MKLRRFLKAFGILAILLAGMDIERTFDGDTEVIFGTRWLLPIFAFHLFVGGLFLIRRDA